MAVSSTSSMGLWKESAYGSIESFRVGRRLLRRCAPRNDGKGCAPRNDYHLSSRAPQGRGDLGAWRLLRGLRPLAMTEKATPPRNDGKGCDPLTNDGREGTLAFRRTSKPSFSMEEEL